MSEFPREPSSSWKEVYVPGLSDEEARVKKDRRLCWFYIFCGGLLLAIFLKAPKWWPVISNFF